MSFDPGRPSHPEETCARLLERFLLDPEELLERLAPGGWTYSPLRLVFHPTPEQVREEGERMRGNLAKLFGRASESPEQLESAERDVVDPPEDPDREVVELVGRALWDVFSNNHRVMDADGTEYDLGSFRASGGFIADAINRRYPWLGGGSDYLDFYMGTLWGSDRADLTPVYRWIFTGLKAAGCRWIYSFPRLHLIRFGVRPTEDDPLAYDPSEAVRAELEEADRVREAEELAAQFEEAAEEAIRESRYRPLPPTVAAYREVYGTLPEGWPHPDM